jgi:hypothetical protein
LRSMHFTKRHFQSFYHAYVHRFFCDQRGTSATARFLSEQ